MQNTAKISGTRNLAHLSKVKKEERKVYVMLSSGIKIVVKRVTNVSTENPRAFLLLFM